MSYSKICGLNCYNCFLCSECQIFFVLIWVYRDFACLLGFSFHLECFMDHDSVVPAQRFFCFFFFSLKSFSIKPNSPSSPLYCLCILHLFHDCYGNMSVVYILYFVSCELYKVKGQVMPIFIPHNKQWLSDFIKHKNHPSSLLNSRVPDSITRAPDTKI